MAKRLKPLNDYVIVELIAEDDGGVPNPDADAELIQTGKVVDPGRFTQERITAAGGTEDPLDVDDEVYWWRFAGSGQTITFQGRDLAHIKYEKLTSVVVDDVR